MCRANVEPQAKDLLARVLTEMLAALAERTDADPVDVTVGPVDLGAAS